MKKRVLSRAAHDPEPLLELLCARLELSPARARELVDAGSVYVGRTRTTQPRPIAIGERLTVFITETPPGARALAFVHRDRWIAVVDKPPGVPSQSERSQSAGALDAEVQRALGEDARLMHRLDKEASGL